MAVSRFPKHPVQVTAKAQRGRVGKWLIGCGCIAPLGLFALVVALGAALQVFDPEGVERRHVESIAKAEAEAKAKLAEGQANRERAGGAQRAKAKAKAAPTPAPAAPAAPTGMRRVVLDMVGCTDEDYYKRLVGYAVDQDRDAYMSALGAGLRLGVCTMFSKGDIVFVEDTAIFSGLVKLRRKGETTAYWTALETIG